MGRRARVSVSELAWWLIFLGACALAVEPAGAQPPNAEPDQQRRNVLTLIRKWPYPPEMDGARVEVYKTVGDVKLKIYIFEPPRHSTADKRPAIVSFFGGGWRLGTPHSLNNSAGILPRVAWLP